MSAKPVAILSTGMVTGVGFNAPASCAAIRCGITGFVETGFMFAGEWLIGCPVPFEEGWRGREKLLRMVAPAIQECMTAAAGTSVDKIPLLLCVAEEGRPGRFERLDQSFLLDVQTRLDLQFHSLSVVIPGGRLGAVHALDQARRLLAEGRPYCVVAGVDSLIVAATLSAYDEKRRLLTARNTDGFIPGEAGAAVLVGPAASDGSHLQCLGVGYGTEPAPIDSETPLRGDGLAQAFQAAFGDSGAGFEQVDFRITDNSGEQYGFKEGALALSRTLRVRKEEFDIWHPADCVGDVGAALVPIVLGVALTASRKAYTPGPGILCHFSSDGGERAAMVLQAPNSRAA